MDSKSEPVKVDLIVISNASSDATVEVAESFSDRAAALGWRLQVLDILQGGKLNALNVGDRASDADIRVYLDADVVVSPGLLGQLYLLLDHDMPLYGSGRVQIPHAKSFWSRAYTRFYRRVPFIASGVPGCGLFAVNAKGRARWEEFPDIISDDTFVRLSFAAKERVMTQAEYYWPIVEGLGNLIRVRRRQNQGVAEIENKYPELLKNDEKLQMPIREVGSIALCDPLAFLVYGFVALVVKLSPAHKKRDWERGR